MLIRMLNLLVIATLLSACGGSSSDSDSTGEVRFGLTDAPSDALTRVQVTVTAIGLKPSQGPEQKVELADPLVIDNLLDLQGANAANLIPFTQVPAGRYNWVRLYVLSGINNTFVEDDTGATFALYVPGQQGDNEEERHVQLVSGFIVPNGGQADFTIDVDLRRAITDPADQDYYLLRPAMRIVDNSEVGIIRGSVADALIDDASCTSEINTGAGNVVYLYTGNNAAPGDIHVDENGQPVSDDNPLTTANVTQGENGSYNYEIGFVAAGDYTVAFTCQGLDDNPDADDSIAFSAQSNVAVSADTTSTLDLQ